MTPGASLTPAGTLGWLRAMSVDIREVAVLDAAGTVLAGDRALAPYATPAPPPGALAPNAAVVAPGSPGERMPAAATAGSPASGDVLVVRSATHAIVVRRGPYAIERLLRADLQAALDALAPR
jgi:hypothetical protein